MPIHTIHPSGRRQKPEPPRQLALAALRRWALDPASELGVIGGRPWEVRMLAVLDAAGLKVVRKGRKRA